MIDPVGVAEIADRLGVRPQTAQQWNYRRLLPPPQWTVSRQPAWNWPDIERWAVETGRLEPAPVTKTKTSKTKSATTTKGTRKR